MLFNVNFVEPIIIKMLLEAHILPYLCYDEDKIKKWRMT
jgi:hypothetical protein